MRHEELYLTDILEAADDNLATDGHGFTRVRKGVFELNAETWARRNGRQVLLVAAKTGPRMDRMNANMKNVLPIRVYSVHSR
jgi:hypothetical protein